MGLDPRSAAYIGRTVWARPVYGYGWSRGLHGPLSYHAYSDVAAAGPFTILVERMFDFDGEPRGIVGTVATAHALFAGLHVVAGVMLGPDECDLERRICNRWRIDFAVHPASDGARGWPTFAAPDILYEGSVAIASSLGILDASLSGDAADGGWS